jgi:hypothetical protein
MAVPRISDLHAIYPSTMGKIELETFGSLDDRDVIDRIVGEAVRNVYVQRVDDTATIPLVEAIEHGRSIEVSDRRAAVEYPRASDGIDGLHALLWHLAGRDDAASIASAFELVLEGLYRNRRIGKVPADAGDRYGSS